MENGNEGLVYYISKIHTRNNFKWIHCIHEVLEYTGSGQCKTLVVQNIQLNHHQDVTKSRKKYLALLELDAKERPNDPRSMHYLGREYMYYNLLDKAIETLKKHITMPESNWPAERAASMRYIASCYTKQGKVFEAKKWLFAAVSEAPELREAYVELAKLEYTQNNWYGVIYLMQSALDITEKSIEYLNEAQAWGVLPYDLLSIAMYNTGNYGEALKNINICIENEPSNIRYLNNKKYIVEKINK